MELNGEGSDLDLGNQHWLQWQYKDGQIVGALIEHPAGGNDHQEKGSYCAGGVNFSKDWRGPVWDVDGELDEHLTISPSVLCSCGDHGFIKDGKWVPA